MANIMTSFLNLNMRDRIGAIAGIIASISGIILWVIAHFFNPYTAGGISLETIPVTFTFLALPALLGLIASWHRLKWLMYAVFIFSLPLSLYLAGTPGIFRYFFCASLGYLAAAILLNKKNANAQ